MSRLLRSMLLIVMVSCSATPPSVRHERASVLRTMASESAPAATMGAFEDHGFKLAGAEYAAYVAAVERRPQDVMWGFYPEKGVAPPGETDPNTDTPSRAAVACAERAFGELRRFIANPPRDLELVVDAGKEQGITRSFYMMINDYTRAADPYPPGVRSARLWYWKRKVPAPPRPAGYWKWESTLTQRGECQTPNLEEAAKYLREKREETSKGSAPAP